MIREVKLVTIDDFKEKYVEGYFLTIDQLAMLVRDFQADNLDGFVSNDKLYIENWLKKVCHK